jgi:diguanylate cyclase (GGDEF)-like protein
LTGIANRRHFDKILEGEFRRAMRDGTSLSLVMIDVDHFKRFNDLYGHPAGDDCLRQIGLTLKGAMHRPGDLAARYGGEEFILLLPNTSVIGAGAVAESVLKAIRALRITHNASPEKIVTSTLGVATLAPKQGLDRPEDLVTAADQMLYAAKAGGRYTVRA